MDLGKLVNLGQLDIYGTTQAKVRIVKQVEVGGSYGYIRAISDLSEDPLDRLPHHRADGWVQVTPLAAISALVRARYTGEAIDREMPTEAHVLLEGTVSARLGKEYLGVLKVEDALDVRPETRAGYHMPGRTISVVFQGMWE
jgi:hypothetical protein